MNYSIDWDGPGESDDEDAEFQHWLTVLDEDVIQAEYGYEPGEFTVYSSHWRPLFDQGLSPMEAWQKALDGYAHAREDAERERQETYARIVAEDEAAIAKWRRENAPSRPGGDA